MPHPHAQHVIKTLLYADIFQYPLTSPEIYQNCMYNGVSEQELNITIDSLCETGMIHKHDFFYSLHNDRKITEGRLKRNNLAKKYLNKGKLISRFISFFPFVRAVFLSGSLSKDCMDKDGDIDYFIVTAPGKLWIARTLLIVFKKVMLFNSYKFFCLNYFIDTDNLEIEDKNLYTATEIVTLLPTFGKSYCEAFMKANGWVREYRPNFPFREIKNVKDNNPGWPKRFAEWLLSGRIGNKTEQYFLNITTKFWQKKYGNYSTDDYRLSIKSKKHMSQINPENFQKRVLQAYHEKVKAFEEKYAVSLN